jgi:hypothetical protein
MRFTFPCYISLDAENEREANSHVRHMLRHAQITFGKENDAPPEFVIMMNISYSVSRAILGEWNPAREKPAGKAKDELVR